MVYNALDIFFATSAGLIELAAEPPSLVRGVGMAIAGGSWVWQKSLTPAGSTRQVPHDHRPTDSHELMISLTPHDPKRSRAHVWLPR